MLYFACLSKGGSEGNTGYTIDVEVAVRKLAMHNVDASKLKKGAVCFEK